MVYSTGADFVKDVLGQKLFTVASSMAQYAGAFANTLGDAFVGIDDQYRSFVKSTGMHAGILEDVYTNIMSPIEPAMYGLEQTAAGAKQLRQMFANLGGISEQTGITTEESAEAMGELMSTVRMMRRSVMEASPEMRVFGVAASRLTADLRRLWI
jgi:methyl-accepting chemotaxis protein